VVVASPRASRTGYRAEINESYQVRAVVARRTTVGAEFVRVVLELLPRRHTRLTRLDAGSRRRMQAVVERRSPTRAMLHLARRR
jgi:hypothetical protein